jgi:hypothetical protein
MINHASGFPGALRIGPLRVLAIGSVETRGLAFERAENGDATITVERLALQRVLGHTASSSLNAASAVLTNVVAALAAPAHGPAALAALTAQQIQVRGLKAAIRNVRRTHARRNGLVLDALGGLQGLVRAYITDALWLLDAEIVIPVTNGVIDFKRVDVEHLGPNSTLRAGPEGVYVTAPHGARIDLVAFDEHGLPSTSRDPSRARPQPVHGVMDLRAIIEAIVRAPADQPFARIADPKLEGSIRRTRLSGELQMGDGALGSAAGHLVMTGRAEGRNRMDLASTALGERIVIAMPQLAAASASLALAGQSLTVAQLSASLEARVVAGANASDARILELSINEAMLRDVKLASIDPGVQSGAA